MKQAYKSGKLQRERMKLVETANEIIEEYEADGYKLTLRQLYYQFVARDIIENTPQSYKRLGDVINEGRLLGLIDWESIEDRTRNLESLDTWETPADIIETCSRAFRLDLWEGQPHRIEVWVEKEALAGIVQRICQELRVPYLACRGYMSQSEMWAAGVRLKRYAEDGQKPIILHLGDHDPSGIDMSRDIETRLGMFMEDEADALRFERIALNMDQVRRYHPPPNPAKLTDARSTDYVKRFGDESWELDALSPKVLNDLIKRQVTQHMDVGKFNKLLDEENDHKAALERIGDQYDEVREFVLREVEEKV